MSTDVPYTHVDGHYVLSAEGRRAADTIRARPFTGTMFHGVASPDSWEHICSGDGLELRDQHESDPGDMGLGVYVAGHQAVVAPYALAGLVVVNVRLRSAIWLDFQHDRLASSCWYRRMEEEHGSPVHGDVFANEQYEQGKRKRPYSRAEKGRDRKAAAAAWRDALLAQGHDGVVTVAWDGPGYTATLFTPDVSIVSWVCRARRRG